MEENPSSAYELLLKYHDKIGVIYSLLFAYQRKQKKKK